MRRLGGGVQTFFYVCPDPWVNYPIWPIFWKMGWLNYQLIRWLGFFDVFLGVSHYNEDITWFQWLSVLDNSEVSCFSLGNLPKSCSSSRCHMKLGTMGYSTIQEKHFTPPFWRKAGLLKGRSMSSRIISSHSALSNFDVGWKSPNLNLPKTNMTGWKNSHLQ